MCHVFGPSISYLYCLCVMFLAHLSLICTVYVSCFWPIFLLFVLFMCHVFWPIFLLFVLFMFHVFWPIFLLFVLFMCHVFGSSFSYLNCLCVMFLAHLSLICTVYASCFWPIFLLFVLFMCHVFDPSFSYLYCLCVMFLTHAKKPVSWMSLSFNNTLHMIFMMEFVNTMVRIVMIRTREIVRLHDRWSNYICVMYNITHIQEITNEQYKHCVMQSCWFTGSVRVISPNIRF